MDADRRGAARALRQLHPDARQARRAARRARGEEPRVPVVVAGRRGVPCRQRQGLRVAQRSRASRRSRQGQGQRSEEHTSELQSLMRISYAVFCLKKKKQTITNNTSKER